MSLWPVPFPNIVPGEHTVVIINEISPSRTMAESSLNRFRLALLSRKSADKSEGYLVQSLESYLEHLTASSSEAKGKEMTMLAEYWEEQMHFVDICEAEEINGLPSSAERSMERLRQNRVWDTITNAWDDD